MTLGNGIALVAYVAIAIVLSLPAAWVTSRRGVRRGLGAAAGVGMAAAAVMIGLLFAVEAFEVRGRPDATFFATGMGSAIIVGLMGLFWLPIQLVAILWGSRRHFERSRPR